MMKQTTNWPDFVAASRGRHRFEQLDDQHLRVEVPSEGSFVAIQAYKTAAPDGAPWVTLLTELGPPGLLEPRTALAMSARLPVGMLAASREQLVLRQQLPLAGLPIAALEDTVRSLVTLTRELRGHFKAPPRAGAVHELLGVDATEFMRGYWGGQRELAARVSPALLQTLRTGLASTDVETLIEGSCFRQVWINTGGSFRSVEVDAAQCQTMYEAGLTLFLLLDEQHFPSVVKFHRKVADELGWAGRLTTSVFVNRPGGGTRFHFDHLENITVQLRGSKRWRLAPNSSVSLPVENHMADGRSTEPDSKLPLYAASAIPSSGPSQFSEVTLEAGMALYVPRGFWHETLECDQESISLFLGFPPYTWAHAVSAAVYSVLISRREWRENLCVLPGHPMPELPLAELAELTRQMFPRGDAAPVGDVDGWYLRNPLVVIVLSRREHASDASDGQLDIAVQLHRGSGLDDDQIKPTTIHRARVAAALAALLDWLNLQRTPFQLPAVWRTSPGVGALLQELLRCGALQVQRNM